MILTTVLAPKSAKSREPLWCCYPPAVLAESASVRDEIDSAPADFPDTLLWRMNAPGVQR